MRVITGTARGKRLATLTGDAVRPTPERIKEAVFSVVQFDIEGRRMLDLFTGSGQMAIEALSRGAAQAVMVDISRDSLRVAEENLHSTGLREKARLIRAEGEAYIASSRERFDIAFLDPPYRKGILQRVLPLVEEHMNPGGSIFWEHPAAEELPESVGRFSKIRDYRYGKILVTLYRCEDVRK